MRKFDLVGIILRKKNDMKIKLALFLLSLFIATATTAEDRTFQFPLSKELIGSGNNDDGEIPSKGKRTSSRPIYCTIDEVNGVTPKFIADTFTYYEIWDENFEYCYFATDSECEFLKEFFSLNYEIITVKYYSDEYVYTGIIYH